MAEIRLIEIKEEILADNAALAEEIRADLKRRGVFLLNLMSSPGSGKTSLIVRTLRRLRETFRIAVIEGDIDSIVDAETVSREGIPAVQLRTGGFCHLDASMIRLALNELDLASLDLIVIENVGNLVCPAEVDTGATKNAMILSVPEGDDKPLKYPLMFSVCDVVILNKTDYLEGSDFDVQAFRERVGRLNAKAPVLEVSCRTGAGLDAWIDWLRTRADATRGSASR
ncbi:MAG: hydrogenase accessory protein HypB [Deltaproteobacteria bacterium HGW-Deltaproteobacteria-19]|jgi:hydrogenase nickel incorporation protein HypB|nr:MAG: hydrogenase accessory protein HypB [Deltaproteobacteria bacterium HGW-Deltaproteobacteria-19]